MLLKGALHVHTTCSDGELDIEQAVQVYADKGFDFIALTDHDYFLRPGCYDLVDRLKTDLLVFKGVERTIFEKGYLHVGEIYGQQEVLRIFNHPSELDLPLDKVVERVLAVHRRVGLHALEITSKGFVTNEYNIPALPFPKVATDDAHTQAMCGRAWVELEARKDKDAILKAIKAGDFWNCFV